MKQRSPVHFVAGFFETIAPYAQRMLRKTERCDILGMHHAALLLIASACMLQNARRAFGPLSGRTR